MLKYCLASDTLIAIANRLNATLKNSSTTLELAIPSRVAVSALALNRNPDTICAHPRRPAANAYCHSR
jgi:hypothetical protein